MVNNSYQHVGRPCRNFNILGSTTVVDPVDGREKVVLSNFAAGGTGNLILVDADTGAGESLPLPGDEGAWAVLNLDDRRLLVGTCPRSGYLHSLDLASRTWAEPLRVESETYIWNLCRGDDGRIYGGTYPGCLLLQYDPDEHRLRSVARMSDNPDNLYSRHVYALPGHILVECWSAEHHLSLWNLTTGGVRRLGRSGARVRAVTDTFLCTESDGELDFFDLHTFEPLDPHSLRLPAEPEPAYPGTRHSLPLADGRIFAVRGQEFYLKDEGAGQPELRPIPTPRPPTRIHTLVAGPDGTIWGSSGFGQTIFHWDPSSGDTWNSQVVCDQGGEVYGMAFIGERLFLSAYSGGDHVVYDPRQPWDQVNNHNPRTLTPAGPQLIRPEARSVVGPDGAFWTGWMARYGVYGGGISRVDPASGGVSIWHDPVPGQPLVALAADERYLYFTTGGRGNGLPPKRETFQFVVWDPRGEVVWSHGFPLGARPGPVAVAGGRVIVAVEKEIWLFDPRAMAWARTIDLVEPCQVLLALEKSRVLLFCGDHVWLLDAQEESLVRLGRLPGPVSCAARTPDGEIFCAHGPDLYHLGADGG